MVPVYTWLDPHRRSYSFGYAPPWSLAGFVHSPAEVVLIAVSSSATDPLVGGCSGCLTSRRVSWQSAWWRRHKKL